ncbi:Apoptosis inhibitor 5 [Mortierella sp. NVP41]|nr:Apoptosis inhibitor 5 [Mortierella sp. NVP41]
MADLDIMYSAYNEIADAGENAPQHVDAYTRIIAGAQGSDGVKTLAAQFIPVFFRHFPALQSKAIDGVFDLCEEDSSTIRHTAIKCLPSLCKDGPQHTIKIADVLCQLLQLDGDDLMITRTALQTLLVQSPREVIVVLFSQGLKGAELRQSTVDFIEHQVMACKEIFADPEIERFFIEEMRKAMGFLSDKELGIFARIMMQSKPYQSGTMDLAGLSQIYVTHISSEVPWDRDISADPLLEFFATHILPHSKFEQLSSLQRAQVLRVYTDSLTTGHPSPTVLRHAGELLSDLLLISVPAEQDSTTPVEFALVECLVLALYLLTSNDPDLLENEGLVARFRNLYNSTQIQLSNIKQTLAASAKAPQDAKQTAKLTKSQATFSNIHTIVKASDGSIVPEFMKPKTLRSTTKLVLHPSWKPAPEPTPVQPTDPKTEATPKSATTTTPSNPTAKPIAKPTTRSVAKPATQTNTKPGSKPTPQQQEPLQSQQQQPKGATNKRKAEPESKTDQKKPKIVRRTTSIAGGSSPRNSGAIGQDVKGGIQSQSQQQAQARAQAPAHSKAKAQTQQTQTQAKGQQQSQNQQQKQRGQSSPKGSPKDSFKSSARVPLESRLGRMSVAGVRAGGAIPAGGLRTGRSSSFASFESRRRSRGPRETGRISFLRH